MLKPLTVWITINYGQFFKRGIPGTGTPGHLTCLLRKLYAGLLAMVRTRHETQTGSKRSTSRLYIVTLLIYLTYMQSTSCEMPGWMRHKLESRFLGEISITSETQMTPPLWQKVKKN